MITSARCESFRQLPGLPPGFDGRNREMELIVKYVNGGAETVAISGPPGVGKSALAAAAGLRLGDNEAHPRRRVFYVSVTDYQSQDQYASAILEALDRRAQLGHEFKELVSATKQRAFQDAVLILDGCDKILKNKPNQFHSLLNVLRSAFRVLTTSCQRYNSRQEILLNPLTQSSACSVLIQLCSSCDKKQANRLVRLCGCMPIAIQIIGAVLRTVYTPDDLLEHLQASDAHFLKKLDYYADNLNFPAESKVTACFETAYQSLGEDLQQWLTCLSLFQSSFTDDEAAEILGMGRSEVKDKILLPLERRSLLQCDQQPQRRFKLHSLVRKFLKERCRETASTSATIYDAALIRFCRFYCFHLRKIAGIYEKEAKRAVRLFQQNRENFVQLLFKFNGLPQVSTLRMMYVRLALDTVSLFRATLSPDARGTFLRSCAQSAESAGDQGPCSRLQLFAIEAILDTFQPDTDEAMRLLRLAEENCAAAANDTLLLIHCRITEVQILLSDSAGKGAFELIQKVIYDHSKNELSADPLLKSAALVAYGNAAEEVGDFKTAVLVYQEAMEFCSVAQGDDRGFHPETCAILLQTARCQFEMEKYRESSRTYSRVQKMQVDLSCDRLSLATTQYQQCIANACAFPNDQDVQREAVTTLDNVESEVERLTDGHPLRLLAPLGAGKILFRLGINEEKSRQKEAKEALQQSEEHLRRALDWCGNLTIDAVDDSELKIDCLAYLSVLQALRLGKKSIENSVSYRFQCCELKAELDSRNATKVTSMVNFVTNRDKRAFLKMCQTIASVRVAFQRVDVETRFTGCLSVLLRRNSFTHDNRCVTRSFSQVSRRKSFKPLPLRAHSLPPGLGKRRSLNSAILSTLIYPSPVKLSKAVSDSLRKVSKQSLEGDSLSVDLAGTSPESPSLICRLKGEPDGSGDESDFWEFRRPRASSSSSMLSQDLA